MQENDSTQRFDLPLSIYSERIDFDPRTNHSRSVEEISLYLSAIFYFIRKVTEGSSLLQCQGTSDLLDKHEFTGYTELLAEIGFGFASELTRYTGGLKKTSVHDEQKLPDVAEEADVAEFTVEWVLSRLLNREDVPEPLREAIWDGIITIHNQHSDQEAVTEFEKTPDYIRMVLDGYRGKNKAKKEGRR